MLSLSRLPTRQRRARKQANLFDPKAFLAQVGLGRTIHHYGPKRAIFSQGERADAVFYIQEGRVRLTVVSKQGKEATIALLGPRGLLGRSMHRVGSPPPPSNSYCNYGLLCSDD